MAHNINIAPPPSPSPHHLSLSLSLTCVVTRAPPPPACTCSQFGESQKLRLVRILKSTVMVRVGGGWVSLDEFLLKNDPCRSLFLSLFFLFPPSISLTDPSFIFFYTVSIQLLFFSKPSVFHFHFHFHLHFLVHGVYCKPFSFAFS